MAVTGGKGEGGIPAKVWAVFREVVGNGPVHHAGILNHLYVLLHMHIQ